MAIPAPAIHLKFDESSSSANAVDEVAADNLTRNGTIPAATGVIGGGRSFSNNAANYFSTTSAAYRGGQAGSWQWSCWYNPSNLTESHKCVAGKGSGSAYEWIVYSLSSDQIPTAIFYNADASASQSVPLLSPLTVGVPAYLSCGYDASLNDLWISVNAGTKQRTTRTITLTGGVGQFNVGLWYSTSYPMNGIIDNLTKWNSTLSDADNTSMYTGQRTWTTAAGWGDAGGPSLFHSANANALSGGMNQLAGRL